MSSYASEAMAHKEHLERLATRRRMIENTNRLFEQAAKAWERGNNSGDPVTLERCYAKSDELQALAEQRCRRLFPGIKIDYPGLYPSFEYEGVDYHTLESIETATTRGPK